MMALRHVECFVVYLCCLQLLISIKSVFVFSMWSMIINRLVPPKKLCKVTQSACFMECVRHQQGSSPCRAFHFRHAKGIYELLPKDITCMADNTTPGTTYVRLSDCESVAPWHRINPNPGPLQWIINRGAALRLRSPMGAYRYIIRVLHQGLWLPGYATHQACTALPDGRRITCRANIQYINSSEPVPYRWVPFSVGDLVRDGAFIAGYWPNGTPLYIVYGARISFGSLSPNYYNAESLRIGSNGSFRPGSLRILVNRG